MSRVLINVQATYKCPTCGKSEIGAIWQMFIIRKGDGSTFYECKKCNTKVSLKDLLPNEIRQFSEMTKKIWSYDSFGLPGKPVANIGNDGCIREIDSIGISGRIIAKVDNDGKVWSVDSIGLRDKLTAKIGNDGTIRELDAIGLAGKGIGKIDKDGKIWSVDSIGLKSRLFGKIR